VRTSSVFLLVTVLVGLALTPLACSSPTKPQDLPRTPAAVTRIDIVGPSVVAPNSTTQYAATALAADGSTGDITNLANWLTSDGRVLSVTATGVATAQGIGESEITIRDGNLRGSLEVLVLRPGTYRVAGTVKEAGFPVRSASVDVVENPDIHTLTDASGNYRLYGVAGDVQMRITKEGYTPLVSRLTVTENESLDFTLDRVSPPANLAGIYTLMLAAGPCTSGGAVGVPDDERTRRYDAMVSQDGPQLQVQLSGAQFATRGNRGDNFSGWIDPDRITFVFTGWNDYVYSGIYFNLVEILSQVPSKLFTVEGEVSATASATGISGSFEGTIAVVRTLGEYGNSNWWSCSSRTHQFALLRR
jgi:hypothetical protein